jgi:hypothetical protein
MDMIAWKGRNYFHDIEVVRLRRIRKIDEVMYEVTDNKQDYRRIRKGVLNFVGKISKILFGTPDDDDADYYNGKKLKHFERNSDSLRERMKEEIYIVKSSFGTVEETLTDVRYNEENVKKDLTQVKLNLDSITSETKRDLYKLSDKITIKNYVAQALEALGTLR